MNIKAYAAYSAETPLAPFQPDRRETGELDVEIKILFCGVCHSDIHSVRNEWGGSQYPLVPGHEIVGKVTRIGSGVSKFKIGDTVGVGCFVDSCGHCRNCEEDNEQYCENGHTQTYNSYSQDKKTITYGGYSSHIVVTERFVLNVSDKLPLQEVAPLLCAGITTYSPLKHWNVKAGDKLAVLGLGGLGHMAVKIASSMGAEVTVLSHSIGKEKDAQRLGAKHFKLTTSKETMQSLAASFDYIIYTVSAEHDYNEYQREKKYDKYQVQGKDVKYVGLANSEPYVITESVQYAHRTGWLERRPIIARQFTNPNFPLYNLIVGGSHTFIANGYVVSGELRDDDYNYENIKWEGINKRFALPRG